VERLDEFVDIDGHVLFVVAGTITVWFLARSGMSGRHIWPVSAYPCSRTTGVPLPPIQ
jgi:hypothetical protein